MARGPLRAKLPQLRQALDGRLTKAQRYVLGELLRRLDELDAALERVGEQIRLEVAECADPFASEAVKLLQTIPGVGQRVAEVLVSEIGVKMEPLPNGCPSGKLGRDVSVFGSEIWTLRQ